MHIQVNSDNHIQGGTRLEQWVRATLEAALERFGDDLTRLEVHLRDENGDKAGPHDKRCQIEARLKGLGQVSVSHKSPSLETALEGAATKLEHALAHQLGKLKSKRAYAA
ncbi:HPF/RaiA family ribosome-associated protein [Pseudomonas sp. NPDC007930]|uniref:HPF/RaiA family ribosome-associated protein n=1 Tax=Pseudomonas sp. NPDC007930 TaxID=3364417 RepID=UPI0036E144F3